MTGRNVAQPRSELSGASAPLDSARAAPRLRHEPGLDGLRGLAVIGVLCFHGGFSWMVGGYLGVSLFFTLSGFLITSLLLSEIQAAGSQSG